MRRAGAILAALMVAALGGALFASRVFLSPVAGDATRPGPAATRWAPGFINLLAPRPARTFSKPLVGGDVDPVSGWILFRSPAAALQAAKLIVDGGDAPIAIACTIDGPGVCEEGRDLGRIELCRARGEPAPSGAADWPAPCGSLTGAATLLFFVGRDTAPTALTWKRNCRLEACEEIRRWDPASR